MLCRISSYAFKHKLAYFNVKGGCVCVCVCVCVRACVQHAVIDNSKVQVNCEISHVLAVVIIHSGS
jgi:hypothetical protein